MSRRCECNMEVTNLADLLHETAEHHDAFEKAAPPHGTGFEVWSGLGYFDRPRSASARSRSQ
jgi:hypothetical protein